MLHHDPQKSWKSRLPRDLTAMVLQLALLAASLAAEARAPESAPELAPELALPAASTKRTKERNRKRTVIFRDGLIEIWDHMLRCSGLNRFHVDGCR